MSVCLFIIVACFYFSLRVIASPGYSEAAVDQMLRQMDKRNLSSLKKTNPNLYEKEFEYRVCHRAEGTEYHFPCTCLWMGKWNWETYKKVFEVEISDPITSFDLRDDLPFDNYSNVTNAFRLFAQYFYNSDVNNMAKLSDESGKKMMGGIGPWPGELDRKKRPVARVLFVARRNYKSQEYVFFVYLVQSDINPTNEFVKLHGAMFKKTETSWLQTDELSWSLLLSWSHFAKLDNLTFLPTYDEFRSAIQKSELPAEFYELKSTVTNSIILKSKGAKKGVGSKN